MAYKNRLVTSEAQAGQNRKRLGMRKSAGERANVQKLSLHERYKNYVECINANLDLLHLTTSQHKYTQCRAKPRIPFFVFLKAVASTNGGLGYPVQLKGGRVVSIKNPSKYTKPEWVVRLFLLHRQALNTPLLVIGDDSDGIRVIRRNFMHDLPSPLQPTHPPTHPNEVTDREVGILRAPNSSFFKSNNRFEIL